MARDPYQYFRVEARELLEGLGRGILSLEKGDADPDLVRRLLRLAHTLKGAARVVRQAGIAERAHALEDALAPWREGAPPPAHAAELLRLVDEIAAEVPALDPALERRTAGDAAPPERTLETVRIEVGELNALLEGVFEAGVPLAALRKELGGFERARRLARALLDQLVPPTDPTGGRTDVLARARSLAEELLGSLERLQRGLTVSADDGERELVQVREAAGRLRLMPASTLFAALERGARDAAQSLGKPVTFEALGGENRVDASALPALRDALLHVVRNAVAHGIESEPERLSAAKPLPGRVELRVERRGQRLAFVCRDDGRGIDVAAVVASSVRRGLLHPAEAEKLGARDALRLVLREGVTTAPATTQVSGRGIGLDVVRATAAKLKGEVDVRSEPGRGTTVELSVPVSLASLPALVVDAGGVTASLPLDAVRLTLRVTGTDLVGSLETSQILLGDRTVPLLSLAAVLRRNGASPPDRRGLCAVVLESEGELAALAVERLIGIDTVVVRSLPVGVLADPIVAGASLEADGSPRLLLDPAAVVAAARAGTAHLQPPRPPEKPPVLVIDDSLTTRMLEQSILESAGYDVELAVSGEEALAKARNRRYRLFVVDIEMPGMDGFEFLDEVRSDPTLRDVPAILVTSRSSSEDRRRGEQAGVRAYIVKSDFDETRLLETIRGLVG